MRCAESCGIVVCMKRSLVGQCILRLAFAVFSCSFSFSLLHKFRAVLAYYIICNCYNMSFIGCPKNPKSGFPPDGFWGFSCPALAHLVYFNHERLL